MKHYTMEDVMNMRKDNFEKLYSKHEEDSVGRELSRAYYEMMANGYDFKKRKSKSTKKTDNYDKKVRKAQEQFDRFEFNEKSLDDDREFWVSYEGYQVHILKGLIREFEDGKYHLIKNKRVGGIPRELFIIKALQYNQDKVPYEIPDYGGCKIGRIMDKQDFDKKNRMYYDSPLNMCFEEPEELIVGVKTEGRSVKIEFYRDAREAAEKLNVTQNFIRQACREYKEFEDGFTDKIKYRPKDWTIGKFDSKDPKQWNQIEWLFNNSIANGIMSDNIKNMEKLGWC